VATALTLTTLRTSNTIETTLSTHDSPHNTELQTSQEQIILLDIAETLETVVAVCSITPLALSHAPSDDSIGALAMAATLVIAAQLIRRLVTATATITLTLFFSLHRLCI
jgi:hypothetical protein